MDFNSLDKHTLVSLSIAVGIILIDLFKIKLPNTITNLLNNSITQLAIGALVVYFANYNKLQYAIVLASILYLSMNVEEEVIVNEKPKKQPKKQNNNSQPIHSDIVDTVNSTVLQKPNPKINQELDLVPSKESDPEIIPSSTALKTQDNSAPSDKDVLDSHPAPESRKLEDIDLSNLQGHSSIESDLAASL